MTDTADRRFRVQLSFNLTERKLKAQRVETFVATDAADAEAKALAKYPAAISVKILRELAP